jgi:sugar O-acyltransferase (sialic acid O-acetyltransferase NeuD family)
MKKKILILGSGGFAKEVAFLIKEINGKLDEWQIEGFVDVKEKVGEKIGGYNVIMTDEDLCEIDEQVYVATGIGNPKVIKNIITKIRTNKNIVFPNLIHPNVVASWDSISLGEGNIITAGVVLTVEITIGSFNIFNLNTTIGHNCIIGDYNVINPGVNVSGAVKIGNCNLIGTGVQILQSKEIKDNIIIGAGSVITKNIIEEGTYIGIPTRKLK